MTERDERWLPAVGYDGYEVSDLGRVRSLDRVLPCAGRMRRHHGKVLTPSVMPKGGHLQVGVGSNNRRYVHHLVMEAFVGPRPIGLEVRHRNGVPSDNRLSNLVYGTHIENAQDMLLHGTNRNARKTRCINDHELSGDNLAPRKDGRRCRQCKTDTDRRRREGKRQLAA